jgi:uncharacterized repeat protein (TIGR04052 family)
MRRSHLLGTFALALAGCSTPTYKLEFAPLVDGAAFSCTSTYHNIGTTASTVQPQDFKMYVHAVSLVSASGTMTPLTLVQDGVWQRDDIALLDFEDGTGTCATASPATNFAVSGTAPSGNYTGVTFTVGLASDQDHLSAATAEAPLNQPDLWWSWLGGYRYFKVDLQTTGNANYFFHLGAEDCTGASMTTIDCKYPNLATVTLTNFKPGTSKIAVDIGKLLANSNVDEQPDQMTTFTPGCMSDPGDTQCPAPFAKMGLAFENMGSAPAQTVFAVQ